MIRLTLCCLLLATPALSQSPQTYSDGKKGTVTLPQGDLSFADAVVAYTIGDKAPIDSAANAQAALSIPDYTGNNNGGTFTTLGCNGVLDLAFTDNALIDLPGPDLYVFEVGPDVEGTFLAISADGSTWVDVGEISGGRSEVDIANAATAGTTYRYVRLTDDGVKCSGNFPGADIDAVAAIGSAGRFTLDGSVLFAVDSSDLRPAAMAALDALAKDIAAAGFTSFKVVGHTDNTGSADYNLTLSSARALAVRDYLTAQPALSSVTATATGAGETDPVADNATDAGRTANRRVEIIATTDG